MKLIQKKRDFLPGCNTISPKSKKGILEKYDSQWHTCLKPELL